MKMFTIPCLLGAAVCFTSGDAYSMQRFTRLVSEFNPSPILGIPKRFLHTQGYRPPEKIVQEFERDNITKRKVIFKDNDHERYLFQGERQEKRTHLPETFRKDDDTLIVGLDLKKNHKRKWGEL